MEVVILEPEDIETPLTTETIVSKLNGPFRTLELMEQRIGVHCMDIAKEVGYQFREVGDSLFFVHMTFNADKAIEHYLKKR